MAVLIMIKKKYYNAKTDRDKEIYQKHIDHLAYKLYDLTDDEIKLVEENI